MKIAVVVFVGKVIFSDDNGSGRFDQRTLVHFQIEEAYKGIPPEIRDVWIDPGSCTSCYADYEVGKRYLVFGYGGFRMPTDTAATSVAAQCAAKPLPSGIDMNNPPKVYSAPECSGTREMIDSVLGETKWLKRYRDKAQKSAKKD